MVNPLIHKSVPIYKALASSLDRLNQPVVTDYQLGILIFQLYLARSFQGEKITLGQFKANHSSYMRQIKKLLQAGIIKPHRDFPRLSVFEIFGKHDVLPEQIACTVDPFAYVSHLSAMEYHGLTDRSPKVLFLSSPPPPKWRKFAVERMKKDLGDEEAHFYETGFPKLRKIGFQKIQKRNIAVHSSIHLGAFRSMRDTGLRVSSMGRTFLDMIRRPDLCGGTRHVIEVYQGHAKQYQNLIIDEVDRHGKTIDKVRAGYILEEVCGLQSETVNSWRKYVQRGGSRKLDPFEEYSSTYSERWCLSLNI